MPILLLSIIASLFFIAGCIGIGCFFIRTIFGCKERETLPIIASYFLFGSALFASGGECAAILGVFKPLYVISVLGLSFLLGVGLWIRSARTLFSYRFASVNFHPIWAPIFLCLLLLVAGTTLTALQQPLAGDAIAQNFVIAKNVSESGWLDKSSLPNQLRFRVFVGTYVEMIFAGLMVLGKADFAKMADPIFLLFGSAMLAGICKKTKLSSLAILFTLLFLFTSFGILALNAAGKADIIVMSWGLAAYFWAINTNSNIKFQSCAVAGFFCGIAVIGKFSYVVPMLPGLVLLIVWSNKDQLFQNKSNFYWRLSLLLTLGIAFSLPFIIATLPYLLKAWVLYGGIGEIYKLDDMQRLMKGVGFPKEPSLRLLLLYPISLFLAPGNHNISILLLGFAPLVVLLKREQLADGWLVVITCASLLGQILYAIFYPLALIWRYLFPILFLMFPIVGSATAEMFSSKKIPVWFKSSAYIFILVTSYSCWIAYGYTDRFINLYESLKVTNSQECNWDKRYCNSAKMINDYTQRGDRILSFTNTLYYLRTDLIQCISRPEENGISLEFANLIFKDAPAQQTWKAIASQGFKYIYFDQDGWHEIYNTLNLKDLPNGVTLIPLISDGFTEFYKIEYSPDFLKNINITSSCREISPGRWAVN